MRRKFKAQTKHEYECLKGKNKVGYECEYYPNLKLQEIYCTFMDYYPQFGYAKVYDDLKKKEIVLDQLEFDSFSEIPTVVQSNFRYVSEYLPGSLDEADLCDFEEKLRLEVEEIISKIIGKGFCYSTSDLAKLEKKQEKDRRQLYLEEETYKWDFLFKKEKDLLKMRWFQSENQFHDLLKEILALPPHDAPIKFSWLINAIKGTKLINDYFLIILKEIDNLLFDYKHESLNKFVAGARTTEALKKYSSLIEKKLLAYLNELEKPCKNRHDYISIIAFTLNTIGSFDTYFSTILKKIDTFKDEYKYGAFKLLIEMMEKTELIKKYFLTLLNKIESIPGKGRYIIFRDLIYNVKGTDLISKYYSQVEATFLRLLKEIDSYDLYIGLNTYTFEVLLWAIEETKLLDKHFNLILKYIATIRHFYGYDRHLAFNNVCEVIKGTEVFQNHYPQIEKHFVTLLRSIDTLDGRNKYYGFNEIIKAAKHTELIINNFTRIESQFLTLLEGIDIIGEDERRSVFINLGHAIEETELTDKYKSLLEAKKQKYRN